METRISSRIHLFACAPGHPVWMMEFLWGCMSCPAARGNAHLYRLAHPLAQTLIRQAKATDLPRVEMIFDYAQAPNRISP